MLQFVIHKHNTTYVMCVWIPIQIDIFLLLSCYMPSIYATFKIFSLRWRPAFKTIRPLAINSIKLSPRDILWSQVKSLYLNTLTISVELKIRITETITWHRMYLHFDDTEGVSPFPQFTEIKMLPLSSWLSAECKQQ